MYKINTQTLLVVIKSCNEARRGVDKLKGKSQGNPLLP